MNAAWEWIVCEKIDKRKQSVQLWSYGSILGNYVCVLLDIIFFMLREKSMNLHMHCFTNEFYKCLLRFYLLRLYFVKEYLRIENTKMNWTQSVQCREGI